MIEVYEFRYNGSCCESSYCTISIHQTQKGAEMAMEFHKSEIKKEWENINACEDEQYKKEFPFDFDQSWDIKKTEILD